MWFNKKKPDLSIPRREMVAVRMEAIGGQGANSAGKILAEAAVLKCGFTGNHFSSFGSEKRGTPVKSFVRFSTQKLPIRTASSVQVPNLLVIFHESLLKSHPEILDGCNHETDVVLNSSSPPKKIQFPRGTRFRTLASIDATEIARQKNCGVNAVMLGALSFFCSEVPVASIRECLDEYFRRRGPQIENSNLIGFDQGLAEIQIRNFSEDQASGPLMESTLPEMGWMNAPLGGVIVNPGNSVLKDHSASRRGVAPQFTKDLCFNCGYCDMVCPDFCFVWELDPKREKAPLLQGIDYQYCKGCQKCISVCPVEALKPVLESKISAEERQFKAYPEVRREEITQRWQHLDWTTYVDRLSDQERMGSLQTELLDPKTYLRPDFSEEIQQKKKDKGS